MNCKITNARCLCSLFTRSNKLTKLKHYLYVQTRTSANLLSFPLNLTQTCPPFHVHHQLHPMMPRNLFVPRLARDLLPPFQHLQAKIKHHVKSVVDHKRTNKLRLHCNTKWEVRSTQKNRRSKTTGDINWHRFSSYKSTEILGHTHHILIIVTFIIIGFSCVRIAIFYNKLQRTRERCGYYK